MSIEELCVLPVEQVAADDALLFLWCPAAGLEEHGLPLLRAWDLSFKTHAVWDKLTGRYGVGSYWRMEHEDLLLGVRPASPSHFIDDTMNSMLRVKRSRNRSEKQPDAHRIVERPIGGPFLELFGRKHVPGWDVFGNQVARNSAFQYSRHQDKQLRTLTKRSIVAFTADGSRQCLTPRRVTLISPAWTINLPRCAAT
jgi:N6-adenosine-specific RNA methylase IME4